MVSISGVLFFSFFFLVVLLLYYSFLWSVGGAEIIGSRSWISSFECGYVSSRVVENYFSGTYFSLLVFFVVFDLEISLLSNLPLQGCGYKNLVCYLFFLVFLSLGFGVEIFSGYVDWGF